MKRRIRRVLKKENTNRKIERLSSYNTARDETSTPQKIREGNEPEAIRQRSEKLK